MKIYITIIMLCCIGCKKDKQPAQGNFKNERVKGVTWTSGGESTYTYDNNKRQVKETSNTGITTEFTYEPGKMVRRVIQATVTTTFTYQLNAEGYVRSVLTPDGTTYTYEYSDKGMLTKESSNEASPFVAMHYYNSATGLQDSIRQTIGGAWHSTITYTYYMDRSNSLRNENLGLTSYGEDALRPVKRSSALYKDGNVIKEQITDFTYTYDGKGRISSKSMGTYTYSYTYY